MTVILDPGNAANSYTDGLSRRWDLTAGLWKTKDTNDLAADAATLAAQIASDNATLATRTSERDSARNSLYVSGTYLSGVTWQTQDGTDAALAAARLAAGSGTTPVSSSFSGTGGFGGGDGNWQTLTSGTFTASVTGVHAVCGYSTVNAQNTSTDHAAGIRAIKNGSPTTGAFLGTTSSESGHNTQQATLGYGFVVALTAGDTIAMQGYQSWGVVSAGYAVTFVPTPSNPH
jgi:hypothetical protein